jgi:hypothetical protein
VVEIKDIILNTVLDNNFDIIELVWSSGMAWWIASLVFSLTITTKLYMAKDSLIEKGLKIPVGVLVSLCMVTMICFGIVVIHDLTIIEASMYDLIILDSGSFNIPNISSIFTMVQKLYVIITSSISVFLVGWLYVWFHKKPFSILQ